MPLTLLLDLDDTLLLNPFDSFMPAYIKLLSNKLMPFVTPEKMVPQLMAATEKMIKNGSAKETLEQVFDNHFYPLINVNKNTIEPLLIDFYQNDFNLLQSNTSERSESKELVNYSIQQDHTLIVATNPLFPLEAMQSRLKWAGFQNPESSFDFITSYETMHFSKPNPAYYAEILGRFGWPNSPIGMVGNSLCDDIMPSSLLGIPSYWVDGDLQNLPASVKDFCTIGKMNEVIHWLQNLENKNAQFAYKSIEAILAILRSTPAVLQYLTEDLSLDDWQRKLNQSGLSILEWNSHLLDVEIEVNLPRINQVLTSDNPFIAGVDSDAWVEERQYQQTRSPRVLYDFIEQRMNTINLLENLTPDQWNRPARHSIFGPSTLQELVSFVAAHDIDHIRQVYSRCSAKMTRRSHIF